MTCLLILNLLGNKNDKLFMNYLCLIINLTDEIYVQLNREEME